MNAIRRSGEPLHVLLGRLSNGVVRSVVGGGKRNRQELKSLQTQGYRNRKDRAMLCKEESDVKK